MFERADRFAKETGRSRSQLYAEALDAFLDDTLGDPVSEALNRVHGAGSIDDGELGLRSARAAIERGDWEW